MRNWVSLTAVVVICLGCKDPSLHASPEFVEATPSALDFGAVEVGSSAQLTVELSGLGGGTLELGPPFSVDEPAFTAPARRVISFSPEVTGVSSSDVVLAGNNVLHLEGTGVERCTSSEPCVASLWSAVEGRCIRSALDDGSACASSCVASGVCRAGSCVGTATNCDDANACTVDACDPSQGCQHVELQCTAPSDACLAAVCDPLQGCVAARVDDGTRCGEGDCATAHVCIEGQCVVRAAPDGATCGTATTCQREGVCTGGQCVRPPPHKLDLAWQRSTLAGSLTFTGLSDGNLYWVENYRHLLSVSPDGGVRYDVELGITANSVGGPYDTTALTPDFIVVSYFQDSFIEARHVADGSFAWRIHLGPRAADGDPFRITDFVARGDALYVVGFHGASVSAGLTWETVLRRIDLQTGAIVWTRSSARPPPAQAFVPSTLPTVALDRSGQPVVGGEAQPFSGPRSFVRVTGYTSGGASRWSADSDALLVGSPGDRVFFGGLASVGWFEEDGGVHLIPSPIPAAMREPVAVMTDAGLVVVGHEQVERVIAQTEANAWRVDLVFNARLAISPAATPLVATAQGKVSFASYGASTVVAGGAQPLLVEVDPFTAATTTCEFDLVPVTMLNTLERTVELPGLFVVSDLSRSHVWAFHR